MRTIATVCAGAIAISAPAPATASVYGDELAKCIVDHATAEDRVLLVRWIFGAMSVSPSVGPMTNVSPELRSTLSKQAAQLFMRLVADDCHSQSVNALKYDGPSTFEASFELLGKVAMRDLMGNERVAREMNSLGDGIDTSKFDALGAEAGLPKPGKK